MIGMISVLLLRAEDKDRWSVILHHADGKETKLPPATAAEHLIAAADIDGDGKVDSTDIYYMLYYVALHGAGQKVSWEDVIS